MAEQSYLVESHKLFSESLIWQLNRNYYQQAGVDAWRNGTVPFHLSSNSMVGKTYANLIFGFLKDLSVKGKTVETAYIVELGAGHGQLAFHILKHLEQLLEQKDLDLPPFCYLLSDIVEDNLIFFLKHPQFQYYLEKGLLDVTYFDAEKSENFHLKKAGKDIYIDQFDQPLIVIANYFFDSIPNDLFYFNNKKIATCSIALKSREKPETMEAEELLKNITATYERNILLHNFYEDDLLNEILEEYRELISDTHLFFPHVGLRCINNLKHLSKKGVLLLTIDKGFHEVSDLDKKSEPELITHGSFSIWVNFHAFKIFCEKQGGMAFFPAYSTFHLELGCLLFLDDGDSYVETKAAYQNSVDDFGPDDFNSLKKYTYRQMASMSLQDLIAILRLSAYDSVMFTKVFPRFKEVAKRISFNERKRIAQTMHKTWNNYFSINESFDLAYEMGGLFYDLGFYKEALIYFNHSVKLFGLKADVFYNQALCHYQLREDELFLKTLFEARLHFPNFEKFNQLEQLDLSAD